jgi:hypothetical protein
VTSFGHRCAWLLLAVAVAWPAASQDFLRNVARGARQPVHHLSEVEILIERTSCFGNCPSYSAQICGHDLSVRYSGEAAERADELGLRKHVTLDEFYALLDAFYRRQFFELPEEYDATPYILHAHGPEFVVLGAYTTDLPSTFLTLTVGSVIKRILLRKNVPRELEDLAGSVDSTLGTDRLLSAR